MIEKTVNTFDVPWIGHPFNSFNFALSTSIPLSEILCPRTIPSLTMKWHFSQLSTKFVSSHLCKTLLRLWRQLVKGGSIEGKVVHEDLHNLLTETMKYRRHTPLKSRWCITYTKRHTHISIS